MIQIIVSLDFDYLFFHFQSENILHFFFNFIFSFQIRAVLLEGLIALFKDEKKKIEYGK